jgi:hypothetical protein
MKLSPLETAFQAPTWSAHVLKFDGQPAHIYLNDDYLVQLSRHESHTPDCMILQETATQSLCSKQQKPIPIEGTQQRFGIPSNYSHDFHTDSRHIIFFFDESLRRVRSKIDDPVPTDITVRMDVRDRSAKRPSTPLRAMYTSLATTALVALCCFLWIALRSK